MAKKIFIWVAHPRAASLCGALAEAYQKGAQKNGADVRIMHLADMQFDTGFRGYGHDDRSLEPDLTAWQEAITWADHVMIIHPYWWGAMPARAKDVLDRALLPRFGFKYRKGSMLWDKLLTGKTGDAIITSDTPPLLDTLIYRKPARRVIRNQVLGFCGIKVRKVLQFGSVKMAKPTKIAGWFAKSEALGASAARA